MRCHVQVAVVVNGKPSKYAVTSCWEPLNDAGECPLHGVQVYRKDEIRHDRRSTDKKPGILGPTVNNIDELNEVIANSIDSQRCPHGKANACTICNQKVTP